MDSWLVLNYSAFSQYVFNMAAYRCLILLSYATCILSEGGLIEPCNKTDLKCLSKQTTIFLEKTCKGFPQYDIKPSDPLIIPELDVVVNEDMGLVFNFKNITITGLKNQQISDFQMDTEKRSVVLKTKADLHILAELSIKFTKKGKEFDGVYTALTTALGSSQYGYSLFKKGDEEYFEVGPETNTCEIIGEPNVFISDSLQNTLNNDPDAKELKVDYEANKVNLRKKTLCKIVETAYITVIHNLRAAGKSFPKATFFKDI